MVDVFREVKRVLRDDGTLWLNLGDSYRSGSRRAGRNDHEAMYSNGAALAQQRKTDEKQLQCDQCGRMMSWDGEKWCCTHGPKGYKPKDLCGIPWRVAFALQADGWWLRSDIIWSKPNPMPQSVTDRPTTSHEYVFLLSKSARYFFDQEAVREPLKPETLSHAAKYDLRDYSPKMDSSRNDIETLNYCAPKGGRNIRSVWTIATAPTPFAHFATFPPALVEPCIKAGTSEKGACPDCGAPWERVVEKERGPRGDNFGRREGAFDRGQAGSEYQQVKATRTLGWRPTCDCDAGGPVPCVCLDPFFGAGTVGLVAARLGRDWIGIELNPEYAKLAEDRIRAGGDLREMLKHERQEAAGQMALL